MIFAKTERLILRALEKSDLPRVAELLNDWDVTKWLAVPPFPYALKDAEEFYDKLSQKKHHRWQEFFAIADKIENKIIGGAGLRASLVPGAPEDEIVIGYWLGRPFWGQGLMSEAVGRVLLFAFQRPSIAAVTATTDPDNEGSQNVLRKAGFAYLGIHPRQEPALRGAPEITGWKLSRADFEKRGT